MATAVALPCWVWCVMRRSADRRLLRRIEREGGRRNGTGRGTAGCSSSAGNWCWPCSAKPIADLWLTLRPRPVSGHGAARRPPATSSSICCASSASVSSMRFRADDGLRHLFPDQGAQRRHCQFLRRVREGEQLPGVHKETISATQRIVSALVARSGIAVAYPFIRLMK